MDWYEQRPRSKHTDASILIIDDKASARRSLRNLLWRLGYHKVLESGNGQDALYQLLVNDVDLVMCDLVMPEMGGVEVLRALRDNEELKKVCFIMVTGERDQASVAEVVEEELDAYILKPFSVEVLESKIEQALARKTAPPQIELHLNLGQAYLKSRRFEEAENEFAKALAISHNSPRAMYNLGVLREMQGDAGAAERLYLTAVGLSPMFIKSHEALAVLYEKRGDLTLAAHHLQKAVEISPKRTERQFRLGLTLMKSGQAGKAKPVFKTAVTQSQEEHSDLVRQVGDVYLEAGMVEEAQEILQQGLLANPRDIHLYNRLGIALRRQGKFDEAVESYRAAIGLQPKNEALHYNLGRAFFEAGKVELAAKALEDSLALAPDFAEARSFLEGVVHKKLKQSA